MKFSWLLPCNSNFKLFFVKQESSQLRTGISRLSKHFHVFFSLSLTVIRFFTLHGVSLSFFFYVVSLFRAMLFRALSLVFSFMLFLSASYVGSVLFLFTFFLSSLYFSISIIIKPGRKKRNGIRTLFGL